MCHWRPSQDSEYLHDIKIGSGLVMIDLALVPDPAV